jgi:hypothetical protein
VERFDALAGESASLSWFIRPESTEQSRYLLKVFEELAILLVEYRVLFVSSYFCIFHKFGRIKLILNFWLPTA